MNKSEQGAKELTRLQPSMRPEDIKAGDALFNELKSKVPSPDKLDQED
jgi:hypothetical protein